MTRAIQAIEFSGNMTRPEFDFLDAVCGWQWGVDFEADVRIMELLFYILCRLGERGDGGSTVETDRSMFE